MKYERIMPSRLGYQWNDAGAYCGSWAMRRASQVHGAYFSQQQERDPEHRRGAEEPETRGDDFKTMPVPQQPTYCK